MDIETYEMLINQLEQLHKALMLCSDLLDPEVFGYSVPTKVHNRAREVFGIKEVK
jgi:hypothetical protein